MDSACHATLSGCKSRENCLGWFIYHLNMKMACKKKKKTSGVPLSTIIKKYSFSWSHHCLLIFRSSREAQNHQPVSNTMFVVVHWLHPNLFCFSHLSWLPWPATPLGSGPCSLPHIQRSPTALLGPLLLAVPCPVTSYTVLPTPYSIRKLCFRFCQNKNVTKVKQARKTSFKLPAIWERSQTQFAPNSAEIKDRKVLRAEMRERS